MCGADTVGQKHTKDSLAAVLARTAAAEKSGLHRTAKSWADLANEIESRLSAINGPDNAAKGD